MNYSCMYVCIIIMCVMYVCVCVSILCTAILLIGDALNDKMHSQLQPKSFISVNIQLKGISPAIHYQQVKLLQLKNGLDMQ